jgi:hypothetical protein
MFPSLKDEGYIKFYQNIDEIEKAVLILASLIYKNLLRDIPSYG